MYPWRRFWFSVWVELGEKILALQVVVLLVVRTLVVVLLVVRTLVVLVRPKVGAHALAHPAMLDLRV